MLSCTSEQTLIRIAQAERLRLILDYDGTLADFAPSPDLVLPDEEVIQILKELNANPALKVAIVSGRMLSQIRKLVPIEGIFLAGTYGIELLMPGGELIHRQDYDRVRPLLEELKPRWKLQINGREGFYLEDKGWSLAIHARFAEENEAETILNGARQTAQRWIDTDQFHILEGDKFLEVGPKIARKGNTVAYLLERYPWENALSIYIGDDDKDEDAFTVVNAHGGITILVSQEQRPTAANCRLDSPSSVRSWLRKLIP
jgi:trehalose 6-phosphate phosphatase